MGVIEQGVRLAVKYVKHAALPMIFVGSMLFAAWDDSQKDTNVSSPTPMPTPGFTGVGGGGELILPTATPTSMKKICVSIDDLTPPEMQSMYGAVKELKKRTGFDPFAVGKRIVTLYHRDGDWEELDKIQADEKRLVHGADDVCVFVTP
ncbi:MAG: hypothetical protein Q8L37_00290 [Candidatus Gottesmanbacteria bacterium]|nr:hypothetical protein [Candidatus Gottesmanbacteria bacterium]